MCKYSLEAAIATHGIVDAVQGDDLVIKMQHGFQKADDDAIVCLRTGTELVLSGEVIDFYEPGGGWPDRACEDCKDQTVTFEEREVPTHWHGGEPQLQLMDILVRPDGRYTMIHYLCRGSAARVLQVPSSGVKVQPLELELT